MIEQVRWKKPVTSGADGSAKNRPEMLAELNNYRQVFRELSALDWDFHEAGTSYLTHAIHPYPAKFIPQIPFQLISHLSRLGELVWDPFGGSGTTALEALLLHRRCISNDISPLANLIGQVKTTALSYDQEKELTSFMQVAKLPMNQKQLKKERVTSEDLTAGIPAIPNLEKWFHKNAILELAYLKLLIKKKLSTQETRNVALVALSRTIGQVSNQDAETRYASRPRNVERNHVLSVFVSNLKSILKKLGELRSFLGFQTARFTTLDLRFESIKDEMLGNSVDLIVTSPPYPNATDYHLYHRFRLFWLGFDPRQLAKAEIGSHLRHQKEKSGFDQYSAEMELCLNNLFFVLRPGRYAAIVVGDAIYHGQLYATAEEIARVGAKIGFQYVGLIPRKIHETQRSFIGPARRAKSEKILILRKPVQTTSMILQEPPYKLWPYERVLREKEVKSTLNDKSLEKISDGNWKVHCRLSEIDGLKRLTFTHGLSYPQKGNETTWQSVIENSAKNGSSSRKESKYVTHGIHAFKGKFYPQLAKVLFNIANLDEGCKVLDPFCGSGTVLLEGYLNGIQTYGCDINPLAVEIAKAKTEILSVGFHDLDQVISEFLEKLKYPYPVNTSDGFSGFSDESKAEILRWFPEPVVDKLSWLLSQINKITDLRIQRYLRILLSSIVRQISQQEPRDLRVRRRKQPISDVPVFEVFGNVIRKNTSKILKFGKVVNYSPYQMYDPKIWLGDSRDISDFKKNGLDNGSIDTIITSPPYATALPYIDTDRLSLLVLFGLGSRDRSHIEKKLSGSREITLRSRREIDSKIQADDFDQISSETAREIIRLIYHLNAKANVGFRRKNMASLLYRYFSDMTKVLANLDQLVRGGGNIYFVIGDNETIAGGRRVRIETTKIMQEIGLDLGWDIQELIPITVTQEDFKHIKHAITENTIIWFRKGYEA